MVDNATMTGNYAKNPFNFKHNNLSKLSLNVNGNDFPHEALSLDTDNGTYMGAFHSLFTSIDKPVYKTGNNISRTDWPGGYALIAYDLTPDLCSGDYQNMGNTGTISVELTFKNPLNVPVNLISYLGEEGFS